jgi:hypothetical protein
VSVVIRRPPGGNRGGRRRELSEELLRADPPLGSGARSTEGLLAGAGDADLPDVLLLTRGKRRALVRLAPDDLGASPGKALVVVEGADVQAREVVRDLRLRGEEPEDIVPREVHLRETVLFLVGEFDGQGGRLPVLAHIRLAVLPEHRPEVLHVGDDGEADVLVELPQHGLVVQEPETRGLWREPDLEAVRRVLRLRFPEVVRLSCGHGWVS